MKCLIPKVVLQASARIAKLFKIKLKTSEQNTQERFWSGTGMAEKSPGDKKGFIRSRDDKFGNPIIYYSGIDNINAPIQGTEMLQEDIKLLLKEN